MSEEVMLRDIHAVVKAAIEEHGATREAMIPILSEVNQAFGYIPPEAYDEIRRQLHNPGNGVLVTDSQLYALASFYHMLSTEPLGKHVIRFCESAPCHVVGGRELLQALKDALKLQPGETSADKHWSLLTTSCLGICGVGPVILVDDDVYGNVTPEQLPEILAKYE